MPDSLSPSERLRLIDLLNSLVQADFEKLVYAIGAPSHHLPSNSTEQGKRSAALLQWVNSTNGCGMDEFLEVFDKVAPGKFKRDPTAKAKTAFSISKDTKKVDSTPTPPNNDVQQNFRENLGSGVTLDMVYIPEGDFLMGSPESELERTKYEGPQHKVTVPAFYMGKYPVTQRQWRAVSLLDDVKQALVPDPSNFKGDDLPVECVSWYDAVEFCQRLSQYTRHEYRLPSEAEWEYACRAGTKTPYYFGTTITEKQVNCNFRKRVVVSEGVLGIGRKKEFRGAYLGRTSSVGNYPPNGFGLNDMHGNVWEWCQDHWHNNYEGSPTDGSAWLSSGESEYYVIRGGSWLNYPRYCRSASRIDFYPGDRYDSIGFRVMCRAPRT